MPIDRYGRDDVLASIDRMLIALDAGKRGVLIVEGAAGSGKTRLLEIAVAMARNHGAVGFFLRLRHGGTRRWMPDEMLPVTGEERSRA